VEVAEVTDRLGNTMRDARTRLGITQAELADRVSYSRRTINSVENGVFIPSTVLALKLAAALSCTVEQLFVLKSDDG
jgi:putative transcriptional regulator